MHSTIREIFHAVQPLNHSLSKARMWTSMGDVQFNGKTVTSLEQEVEITEGCEFQVSNARFIREGDKWIRIREIQPDEEYRWTLANGSEARIRVSPGDKLLMIGVEGYGECTAIDGKGFPIVLDDDPALSLHIWGNINQEDPTHDIPLIHARENNRRED